MSRRYRPCTTCMQVSCETASGHWPACGPDPAKARGMVWQQLTCCTLQGLALAAVSRKLALKCTDERKTWASPEPDTSTKRTSACHFRRSDA